MAMIERTNLIIMRCAILFNFLNQPETWFASLVEPQTQQRRMAFPKASNGDSLPAHTAYELLGSAHGSHLRSIGAQRWEVI